MSRNAYLPSITLIPSKLYIGFEGNEGNCVSVCIITLKAIILRVIEGLRVNVSRNSNNQFILLQNNELL